VASSLVRRPVCATAAAPDFTETPAHLTAPMLVSVGERDTAVHDPARRATAGLPRVTFVSLPGLGHGAAIARSDLALPHIQRFLADRAT
jgi:pimeloyl-ACP methyl ester carboxylesterase